MTASARINKRTKVALRGQTLAIPFLSPLNKTKLKLGNNPKDRLGSKKVSISKVPPIATILTAMAMIDGSVKYGAYNWRENKVIASIYIDALNRHVMAWWDGEENASDSGVSHLGHALANLSILADAKATGNLIDDRPRKGRAAEVLKELEEKNKNGSTAKIRQSARVRISRHREG